MDLNSAGEILRAAVTRATVPIRGSGFFLAHATTGFEMHGSLGAALVRAIELAAVLPITRRA